ncbi:MAG: SMC family ATPase [Dehalococcoidia bacterium]|nr:SMC family ATPase [Dehalococcoidia bacterium]
MKNFMCYRENMPVLDFEGIHVACLCGDNGSGKSSIFDAVTWALWGEASRGKSNDDLIYSSPNANEMEVELEFLSGADRYRVIRKHTRSTATRSGQSLLEFQLCHQGIFKSLSEHTKAQTQDKIQNLLHLDYQTFINSAMILQGRANEFSNKRPGERKEILANILDLSFYDQMEQQARTSSEIRKLESINLERDIDSLVPKLNEKAGLEEIVTVINDELLKIENSKTSANSDILKLRAQKELLVSRKEQLGILSQQIESKKDEINLCQKRFNDMANHIQRYTKILSQSEEIEKGYAEYRSVLSMDEQLNDQLKKIHNLNQRKKPLEELIASIQNTYYNKRKILSSRLAELTAKSERLPQFRRQYELILQHQNELDTKEQEIESKGKLFNQITATIGTLSSLNSELLLAADEIRGKMAMLSHAGATCPLCESELGPDGCDRIKNKLSTELANKLALSQENIREIANYKAELASLEKESNQMELSFKSDRDSTKQKLAVLQKEISDIEAASEEEAAKKDVLHKLEEDIKNMNYAIDERKALQTIEQEQNVLGYDPDAHKKISERKIALQHFEDLQQELSEAKLQYATQQKNRIDYEITIASINDAIANLAKQHAEITGQITELPRVLEQLAELEHGQQLLSAKERATRDHLAECKEKLKQIDLLGAEKQDKEAKLRQYRENEAIFSELARCFSKKGIQALIIGEALPEIENEANLLLGKMTDNRMSLTLETQRGTKKGDMIETLDIKIADELGTRTYDMYSGGEAFRIDLALRIAISRLLVRRVGAAMPILIIDEGFGTQDNLGLEKLIEAINAIQDDFEKVFVITHLEELKDRFPTIISVTKTMDGSLVSVVQ